MPLDYQTDTGPKLAVRFSMGEYNGSPCFLLQSSRGLLWKNLPPEMEQLAMMPNMGTSAKNFAIGSRGLFWYTYRSVNDVYEQKGASNLWSTLNEDWKGGCPIRLVFGPGNYFWGEKEWIENGGHLVQAFGVQPQTLINESKKRFPGMRSYEIDFVAIGKNGCWIMGTTKGDPIWSGIDPKLEKSLKREIGAGHKVRNVVLSPVRDDLYWIEYSDGTVDYNLPSDWDLSAIATHVVPHTNVREAFQPWELPAPSTSGTTTVRPVMQGTSAWDFVNEKFKKGWRHPHKQPAPQVVYVFEVILSGNLHTSYQQYLDRIEKKHRFSAQGAPPGNQAYGWHGTRRRCQIGENGRTTFCNDTNCATCLIMTGSFNAGNAGNAPGRNFLRFGKAIYTSEVSSKADDYASSVGAGLRSLILARMVKGKADKRLTGDKKLTAPPAGFDCVEGCVGKELNYEECCLYHNDAVRPAFLVLYR